MGTGKGEATARFDLSGMRAGQRAGFARFGGIYHLLGVHVERDGLRRLFFDANGQISRGPVTEATTLYIRTANDGNQARFAWSADRRTFHDFGPAFTLKFGQWTGDRLGFFCWNDGEPQGFIDVDWFQYSYDGPKANTKCPSP
jgi:hypothetical protein